MADQGIKNIVVKKELLGKTTSDNKRIIRFRLVSEDKNRKSPWSQSFFIDNEPIKTVSGDLNIIGNTIIVNWFKSSNFSSEDKYDIFVSFDGAEYSNIGIANSNTYSFLKTGTSSVRVLVQAASINPVINNTLKVYDSGVRSLV